MQLMTILRLIATIILIVLIHQMSTIEFLSLKTIKKHQNMHDSMYAEVRSTIYQLTFIINSVVIVDLMQTHQRCFNNIIIFNHVNQLC